MTIYNFFPIKKQLYVRLNEHMCGVDKKRKDEDKQNEMNRQGRQISTGTTKRKAHDDGRWRRAPGLHAHGGRLEGDLEVLAAQRVAVHVGDGVHRVGHAVELHEAVPLALPRSLIADHL